MPLPALAWQDYAVIVLYLAAMIAFGAWLARRKRNDEEYFLAGRRMPWFAVGMSVIASLLSSLTYLSEPAEVWKSGVTHMTGKMLAIPFEMLIVWIFCVPFMMRFRFTSAYEYLEHRFGVATRRLGVVLFIIMVVLWMGFVVLASARALSTVSGISLFVVILTVGAVATLYTMLGGLRAVIWTDVIQVLLLIGGGLFTIGYVAWTTDSSPLDWYHVAMGRLNTAAGTEAVPVFSWDPTIRATVVTVAVNMCIWHVCTHVANQMTVQRYFSTSDIGAARRSFVTGSLFGVGLNLMLMLAGLAVLYYYVGQNLPIDGGLSADTKERDLIFPTFAINHLPTGVGGAVLAALLAAAMSSIDSGVNSIATVVTVEWNRTDISAHQNHHVRQAMGITLCAGAFITIAAYALNFLPDTWGIVGAMPRTFNAVTAPLGGLFLIGMFVPRANQFAGFTGTILGLSTSLVLGYLKQIGGILQGAGLLEHSLPDLSFTWIMPTALCVTVGSAFLLSLFAGGRRPPPPGYTWST
ncbi:MAG TPA: hypothetical protein DCY79_21750, partial [Planctomycetaceae bacterium]|nr:hypothetical protein [Planctomycetaceae bacterium]